MKYQEILNFITENKYFDITTYAENKYLKFILITSPLQRKHVLLKIPNHEMVYTEKYHYEITEIENNYKNKKQRDYLHALYLDYTCCITSKNITIQNKNDFSHFIIHQNIPKEDINNDDVDSIDLDDNDEKTLIDDRSNEDDDIHHIHFDKLEFPIEDIKLVTEINDFMHNVNHFELETLIPFYYQLSNNENIHLEKKINILENRMLAKIDQMRDGFHSIHQQIYNLHLDIQEYSKKLQKLLELQKNNKKKSTQTNFKITRLIEKIENTIDKKNTLLNKYRYQSTSNIDKFLLDISNLGFD